MENNINYAPLYRWWLGVDNLFDWKTQTIYNYRLVDVDFDSIAADLNYNVTKNILITPGILYHLTPFAVGYGYDAQHTRVFTIPQSSAVTFPDSVAYVRFTLEKAQEAQSVKKFTITGGYDKRAYPVYKSDFAIDCERETNQQFFRRKLSGKLDFLTSDYDYILSHRFDLKTNVLLEDSLDGGKTWQKLWEGEFWRTDCAVDVDNKKVTVQPSVNDEYSVILTGLENEIDLLENPPISIPVEYYKRPLLQVYQPGQSVITNYLANNYWEEDAEVVENSDRGQLISKYKFALASVSLQVEIRGSGVSSGIYRGNGVYSQNTDTFTAFLYRLGQDSTDPYFKYQSIKAMSDDKEIFEFNSMLVGLVYKKEETGKFNQNREIVLETSTGVRQTIYVTYYVGFMRYLLNTNNFHGEQTYPIPIDDIVPNDRRYKYIARFKANIGYISGEEQINPTKWGRTPDGTYYLPPKSLNPDIAFIPINRNAWGQSSYWIASALIENEYEEAGRTQIILPDAYPLSVCINNILNQIAPGITHEQNEEYSKFLYSSVNPITQKKFVIFITPKSNIRNGEYATPAQKATISLMQITNMLRDCFNCYWYIEDNKFKIEHISFFQNGKSYTGSPLIGLYLTNQLAFMNGKHWTFGTNKYDFDKNNMPERYVYKWMDDVTTPFSGLPIEILSDYVEKGKKEEISISKFTSDIDFIVTQPNEINQDGFVLLLTEQRTPTYFTIPFVELEVDGIKYNMQNGYAAMAYLQPNFLIYNMPAPQALVNNTEINTKSVARNKKQTINIPIAMRFNPFDLIKTEIGEGIIEKISINLESLIGKATLKYETE